MASNTRSHMCVKIMVMGVLPWLGVFIRCGCSFYIPIAGWNAKLFQCTVKCCLQKPLRKGLNIDFAVLCDVGKSEKSSLFGFQAHEIWKTIKNSCLFNQAEYEYEINYFGKCFALDLCKGWMESCKNEFICWIWNEASPSVPFVSEFLSWVAFAKDELFIFK